MLNKLRKRFVITGTLVVFVFLLIIVAFINVMNYKATIESIDNVIDVVTKPRAPFFSERVSNKDPREAFGEFLPKNMSPEVPFETRFFSVTISSTGEMVENDKSRIITIQDSDISYFVEKAKYKNSESGFVDNFRFKKIEENDNIKYVFVDCGRKLESFYMVLKISCIIAFLGCVTICCLFIAVSDKVVSPIVDSYNKQKSFITNAGHELKTPLTIISANADLIESEYGNNEAIDEIKKQTEKLTELTNDLVYLSKTEEKDFNDIEIEFPISDLILDTIESFNSSFINKKIEIKKNIEPLLSIVGNQNSIERVINILIENALKYTPSEKEININLYSKNKKVIFSIENDVEEEINENELESIFERFYRLDKSRNSNIGGHGLGLSIAKAIVEANNGKISAMKSANNRFLIEVSFTKNNSYI